MELKCQVLANRPECIVGLHENVTVYVVIPLLNDAASVVVSVTRLQGTEVVRPNRCPV